MSTSTTYPPAVPNGVKIFGREPAAWAGVLESVLALLFVTGALAWTPIDTPEEVAIVLAGFTALLALYTAYATHQVTVAILVGVLKAGVALGAVFGLQVSVETVAAASLVVSAVFALVNRQLATPVADGEEEVWRNNVRVTGARGFGDGELLGGYR